MPEVCPTPDNTSTNAVRRPEVQTYGGPSLVAEHPGVLIGKVLEPGQYEEENV